MEGVNPLELVVEQHRVVPGLEDAVVGMNRGDKRTLNFEITLQEISATL